MIRFSRTVSSLSSVSCCGTTPRRPRISGPFSTGSRPRIRSVPAVGGETQPIMRIVELLPAPFGPRNPKASPRCTSKSMPSTATMSPNVFTRPRAWISGACALIVAAYRGSLPARCSELERFGELGELLLVGERELDATAPDLRVEARQLFERVSHPGGDHGVDGRCTRTRLLLRPRPLRPLLGGAHRETLLHDLPREPPPALMIRDRKHGARMPLRELPALEHPEHVVRQVEQADAIRHGRLRPADALRDLAEREPELVQQDRVGACLLGRRELLAGHVLDEAEQQRFAVVGLAHDGRNG